MENHEKMYEPNFFEGAEKLLEIWFCNDDFKNEDDNILGEFDENTNISNIIRLSDEEDDEKMSNDSTEETIFEKKNTKFKFDSNLNRNLDGKGGDLRRIPRSALEQLLQVVKCEIISFRKNEHIDSYVLSESSMFVSYNRFILKTCGNTVLLKCLKPLLYLVKEYAGFNRILDVFYSHKNFMHPELQDKIHSRFDYEIEIMNNFFQGGAAYCFGRMNKECWYFFTLNLDNPSNKIFIYEPDQTLEIIMQNLDEQKMQLFNKKSCNTAKEATVRSGIDKIFSDAVIDDYLFDPCGYSMNGIIKGQYYFTIHITPEPECSYVSFETNYPMKNYQNLISKILKIFNPQKFTLTLFANENSVAGENNKKINRQLLQNYKALDLQICRVKNYDLIYAHFAKHLC